MLGLVGPLTVGPLTVPWAQEAAGPLAPELLGQHKPPAHPGQHKPPAQTTSAPGKSYLSLENPPLFLAITFSAPRVSFPPQGRTVSQKVAAFGKSCWPRPSPSRATCTRGTCIPTGQPTNMTSWADRPLLARSPCFSQRKRRQFYRQFWTSSCLNRHFLTSSRMMPEARRAGSSTVPRRCDRRCARTGVRQ